MSKLLDPKILISIKQLVLAAKITIDGFMNGINKSAIKGVGMEFSQYRSYQPGDDLRSLDWKMFARSDRYYIREAEIETNIAIRLLVDASASMNHSDGDFKKIDYAKYTAACLAYLANLHGDAVGLYVCHNEVLFAMPAKQDYQHLARLLYQLEQIKPAGHFTRPIAYQEIFARRQQRELLIFITDFYQKNSEITDLLDKLSTLRHEIIVLHIVSKNELTLNFKGYNTFEDLETGETIQINQEKTRTAYQEKINAHLTAIRTEMLDRRIYYRTLNTGESIDQALRDFLKQRQKIYS